MYRNKILLVIFLLMSSICSHSQQGQRLTTKEQESVKVFNGFTDYIIKIMHNDRMSITDSSAIEDILLKYVFINRKQDSSTSLAQSSKVLTTAERQSLEDQLETYFSYFSERKDSAIIENVAILPIRLSTDHFIYDRMTQFQKDNTFILYDKRKPDRVIADMLFIPATKGVTNETRIWSWLLGFKFTKFYFTSAIGEEGWEYLF